MANINIKMHPPGSLDTVHPQTNAGMVLDTNEKVMMTSDERDKLSEVYDKTPGYNWIRRQSAADNNWYSVCYGNGLFVAVARTGTGNRVMTSPDGINWTIGISPADNYWESVCYGNGLFVAVARTGTGNRVMTSPDGINWTIGISPADNNWRSVCYGNGLFVAVAYSGSGNRVMTSPDGINWTIRQSAADNNWRSVCYGNGLFVAVAYSGTGNRVMTSPDGINWTIRQSAADNTWESVCYGNGLFVAVAQTGTWNRVMTSLDGINWTIRQSAADNDWRSVCYGNGLFVAVAYSRSGNKVMTSPDGINWTIRQSAADNYWESVCYGNGLFVAVACSGTGNRVMTSGQLISGRETEDYNIDTRTSRYVIGTSTSGWTTRTCDYLCDGVDDQEEINAAIQALPVGGGEILLLDGTYNISNILLINRDNVSLTGSGPGTLISRTTDSGETLIMVLSDNVTVSNLYIKGNRLLYDHLYNSAILIYSGNHILIDRIIVEGTSGRSINSIVSHFVKITNCTVLDSPDCAIYLDESSHIIITNNTITGGFGLEIYDAHRVVAESNLFYECEVGVRVNSGVKCNISGNILDDNDIGILLTSSEKNSINNNTCTKGNCTSQDYQTGQYSIQLSGTQNNNNYIANNLCLGKAPDIQGGNGNTLFSNKYDWMGPTLYPDIVSMSSNKTLNINDAGCVLNCINASDVTVTIPANTSAAFPVGTEIGILRVGIGDVTLVAASGVTLNSDGGKKKIKAQYTSGALKKTGLDTWVLVGNLA